MNKIYSILIIIITNLNVIYSQNLLIDPSFEKNIGCPKAYDFKCAEWVSISGTVDYYHVCADSLFSGIPKNKFGYHPAKDGNAYCGLIVFDKTGVQEFLQGKLFKPLLQNQFYRIKFYVRYTNPYEYLSIWKIGALLTDTIVLCNNDQLPCFDGVKYSYLNNSSYINTVYPKKIKASIENDSLNFIDDNKKWVEISGIYKAKGGEKIITIGGFYINNTELNNQIKEIIRKSGHRLNDDYTIPFIVNNILKCNVNNCPYYVHQAYYFIDDVSVVPVDSLGNEIILYPELLLSDTIQEEVLNIDSIEIGKPITLNNIYFEFDKSKLLPESYPELNKLVKAMQKNETMMVEISGHTDNSGTEEYNFDLSQARAKVVVDYLIEKGIKSERLKYIGYGRSKPIADNTTEEGKAQNRRVEFTILKK